MPDDAQEQVQELETQQSNLSFTSTTDQVQNLVKALVESYQTARREIPARELKAMLQGRDPAGRDLELYESWLAEAHTFFREASNHELTLTFASEWVLDNYYIIRQALQQIIEDLPRGYYRQLPKLTDGSLKGLPRIYAIARGILNYQQYLLNPIDLETILIQLQNSVPLTMGELWALPIFLRYSCIETLAHELERVIHPQKSPHLPVLLPQLLEGTGLNPANQAAGDDRTVANIVLSLRGISEQNWNDFFESVSRLDRILRTDPSGIYAHMDFKTRDLYRKEIELLSLATGRQENELAEITLDLTRKSRTAGPKTADGQPAEKQGEGFFDDSQPHIGEYLLGKSRAELEEHVGYHPDVKTALKRWGFRHASFLYLGSITLITLLIFVLLALVINLPVLFETAVPLQRLLIIVIGFILLVPVLTGAASLTSWAVTLRIPPRILPKLHFKEEIPPEFLTLVVIPAMITDREEVDSLTRQIEMHYLRNPEPGLLFALLTDFRDADLETLPEDDELLNYAEAAIAGLNAKYKRPSSGDFLKDPIDPFIYSTANAYGTHRKGNGWGGSVSGVNCTS